MIKKRYPFDSLVQDIKRKNSKSLQYSKDLIRKMFKRETASGFTATELRVSLLCPIGKTRIITPARFDDCKHVQCFDALTFFKLNENKPSWTCPICFRRESIGTLHVDRLLQVILTTATDCDQIKFSKDGSWSRISSDVMKSPEEIDLTISSDDDDST